MNLSDINTVEKLLKDNGFSFKKSLGQNFLINNSVCPNMASAACDKDTGVIEIGPGIGVLTCELANIAKKVVAIELDERLKKILQKTLKDYNNINVIYGDAMKLDLKEIIANNLKECSRVCICANLPYYITSPLIMKLLEQRLPIDSITVMVQQEAAERLCAKVGTREAGAVTVAVDYFSEAKMLFDVDRHSFIPAPKVDSAVIQLKIRKSPAIQINNEDKFFKFVKSCFAQRRKTLINTVSNTGGITKELLKNALKECNLDENIRSEKLSMENLRDLYNHLFNT